MSPRLLRLMIHLRISGRRLVLIQGCKASYLWKVTYRQRFQRYINTPHLLNITKQTSKTSILLKLLFRCTIFFLFFFLIHFNASDCLQDIVSQFQCDAKCVEKKTDQRIKNGGHFDQRSIKFKWLRARLVIISLVLIYHQK